MDVAKENVGTEYLLEDFVGERDLEQLMKCEFKHLLVWGENRGREGEIAKKIFYMNE